MPRYQVDDCFYNDPAVIRAGTAAFGLYSRCGGYVAQQLTDGFVPSEVAAAYGTPEWIRKLLDVGLWESVDGGFFMPRYLNEDKNPSRDKVLADRKMKQERQQRWLDKTQSIRSDQRRVSRRVIDVSQSASQDASKDDALTHPLTGMGTRPRAKRGAAGVPPPPPLNPGQYHAFVPDGGGCCAVTGCGLPRENRRHGGPR